MTTAFRLRVVLGLMHNNYPQLLGRGKAILNGIASHPQLFVSPEPSLLILKGKIDGLDQAQQDAAARTVGMVALRNLRGRELISCLEGARTYVQQLVDQNPEQGLTLISSAAMLAPKERVYTKPLIEATQEKPSGVVSVLLNIGMITAGIRGKVSFNWQIRGAGVSDWGDLPSTPHGHTEVANLTPLTTYAFRASVTSAEGVSDWCQAVTLLVL